MGQSLVGGLLGGAGGAVQGFISGGVPGALALGAVGFVGGFASSYLAKQATADALSSAMGPSAAEPKFGGYNVNRRGAALHHQVVYGQTKVGGVVVFDDAHGTNGVANTDNNKYLSRIIAYAGHEIESFEKIYIGGSYRVGAINSSTGAVTGVFAVDQNGADVGSELTGASNPFNGYLSIREVLGGHTTSLNGQSLTNFSDDWTSSHRLLGIAHLAILFEYAEDVWDEGLPEVTALIKGKKVLDPRTSTTAWSDNPALIVRDFLTNSVYGLGESASNIDDTLVGTAADICEAVDWDTSAPKRYTCNGAWTTSQPPVDVIAQLMTSCAGYLWYAQGKWRLKAGKYVAPTITLTEDDLRSPLSVATRHSRRDNFNAVRGTFKGPKTNYQFTDYPTVTATNFVTIDGGLESTMDLALPFTDTPEEAQRLATIALEKNRSQITITGSFGLGAFGLQVGDNVNITNTRFGWTDKLFEVVAWSLSIEDYQLSVNLVLRETTPTTYDEELNTTGFESDNTNLPGALGEVVVGGVTGTDDVTGLTAEGGIRSINSTWTNPVNDSYGFTRIYYNTSAALNIGQYVDVVGESHSFSVNPNVTYYLLAQAYDNAGTPNALGTSFPSSGFISATSKRSDTDDVVNSAISQQAVDSNVTNAGSNLSTSFGTTGQLLGDITLETGNEVLLSWSVLADTDSGASEIDIQILRDSSQIYFRSDIRIPDDGDTMLISANFADSNVGPGQKDYKVRFRKRPGGVSGSTCQILDGTLIVTELKK
jgi:hypothetical protein